MLVVKTLPGCRKIIEAGHVKIFHDAGLCAESSMDINVASLNARCEVRSWREGLREFHLDPSSIDLFEGRNVMVGVMLGTCVDRKLGFLHFKLKL